MSVGGDIVMMFVLRAILFHRHPDLFVVVVVLLLVGCYDYYR